MSTNKTVTEYRDDMILTELSVNSLNSDAVTLYTHLFFSSNPNHIYNRMSTLELLEELNAIKKSEDGSLHPTVAGLLMFGEPDTIKTIFPGYYLNYDLRDEYEPKPTNLSEYPRTEYIKKLKSSEINYIYGLTEEGTVDKIRTWTWNGNLVGYYYNTLKGIFDSIKRTAPNNLQIYNSIERILVYSLSNANFNYSVPFHMAKYSNCLTIYYPGYTDHGTKEPYNENIFNMFYYLLKDKNNKDMSFYDIHDMFVQNELYEPECAYCTSYSADTKRESYSTDIRIPLNDDYFTPSNTSVYQYRNDEIIDENIEQFSAAEF